MQTFITNDVQLYIQSSLNGKNDLLNIISVVLLNFDLTDIISNNIGTKNYIFERLPFLLG